MAKRLVYTSALLCRVVEPIKHTIAAVIENVSEAPSRDDIAWANLRNEPQHRQTCHNAP
jgi:hypothetical protein